MRVAVDLMFPVHVVVPLVSPVSTSQVRHGGIDEMTGSAVHGRCGHGGSSHSETY